LSFLDGILCTSRFDIQIHGRKLFYKQNADETMKTTFKTDHKPKNVLQTTRDKKCYINKIIYTAINPAHDNGISSIKCKQGS